MIPVSARYPVLKKIQTVLQVRAGEMPALGWSWLYVFCLFLCYYVLRPIRDELGAASGVDNLPWLFTGTLAAMVALNPVFGYLVKRWPRHVFIAIAYRAFMALILLFAVLLYVTSQEQQTAIGWAFFIFVSVFNLFVVSVFWSLIVDVFTEEQGRRLFGVIAAGATLGGIAGAAVTGIFVAHIGQGGLMILSILLLEGAVFASGRLACFGNNGPVSGNGHDRSLGGGVLSGLVHTFRSPYLLGISAYMLLNSVTATFLYFQQASIAEAAFSDKAARTAFFANIDLWVNSFTLLFQLLLLRRLIKVSGVTLVLCALPLVSIIGFGALAYCATASMVIVVQVTRRVGNFGLSRPARELLFIPIVREDRYKAKNFIDTVVYRGGDQLGSWAYTGIAAFGMSAAGLSAVAIPLSGIWLLVSFLLGKRQNKLS